MNCVDATWAVCYSEAKHLLNLC